MTDPANTPDLLPCPFCGGEAKLETHAVAEQSWITCPTCQFDGFMPIVGKEGAVRAWNTRPAPAVTVKPLGVKYLAARLVDKLANPFSHTDMNNNDIDWGKVYDRMRKEAADSRGMWCVLTEALIEIGGHDPWGDAQPLSAIQPEDPGAREAALREAALREAWRDALRALSDTPAPLSPKG